MAQCRDVVDHEDVARPREWGQVRGRDDDPGGPGCGERRQGELLPGVAGAVRERPRRPCDEVGARAQRGQPCGDLARPAFDPPDLEPGGRTGVDHGQRSHAGHSTPPGQSVAAGRGGRGLRGGAWQTVRVNDRRPRALITGIDGQDGSYLAELLLRRGYDVWGTVRTDPDG